MTKYQLTIEVNQDWFNILGDISRNTNGFVWVDVKQAKEDSDDN
jgi:hypothetical protein